MAGPLQVGNVTSTDFVPSTECIWNKNINSLSRFQSVFTKITTLLDPKRPLGGDYCSLADEFGMDRNDINYLGSRTNPTETLLNKFNPTLAQLRTHLLSKEVERPDVVKVIAEWIKEQCDCETCTSGSLT
ncbi:uncharacterized protein LOC144650811 [Oculina patagonica]